MCQRNISSWTEEDIVYGINEDKLEQIALREMREAINGRNHIKLYESLIEHSKQYENEKTKTD